MNLCSGPFFSGIKITPIQIALVYKNCITFVPCCLTGMKSLTEGEEGKLILYFTMPMLLGNVFQQLYSIVDSIVVGNYLEKLHWQQWCFYPIFFALISQVVGITMETTIVIAQLFSAQSNMIR
jgi:Na+-driven multidrug efflux pump